MKRFLRRKSNYAIIIFFIFSYAQCNPLGNQKPRVSEWKNPKVGVDQAPTSNSTLGVYENAAISTDGSPCAEIGSDILKRGGKAADGAIAALFCNCVTVQESMGLGGGFFLTYYDWKSRKAYSLDARETAPAASSADMFAGNESLSTYGGLAIAVPGESRGYWELYQRFGGGLPWGDLIEPSITLCEDGFPVSAHMANALTAKSSYILNEPSMSNFINPATGTVYQAGDILKLPQLAATLKTLQKQPDSLYTGSLSVTFLEDLKALGSIITKEDLANYKPVWRDPVAISIQNGNLTLYSIPPPGSGAILGFILNILDNYNFTRKALRDKNIITTYQRVTESFKFGYGQRTELGDEDFVDMTALLANLTSDNYARDIYLQIMDNMTFQDPAHYGATTYTPESAGTSHLAVLSADGDAVSVTSTINLSFGAVVASASTGIVLNDEMDDFSSPNVTNNFGFPPSPSNFIVPGKRPMSSMCPAIFVDNDGAVKLVTGAAGGSMITTATAWQAMHYLWLGDNIKESIDRRRLHHQLFPMQLQYEEDFRTDIIEGLQNFGHNTSSFRVGRSIVCSVGRESNGQLNANSDFRKTSNVDGF